MLFISIPKKEDIMKNKYSRFNKNVLNCILILLLLVVFACSKNKNEEKKELKMDKKIKPPVAQKIKKELTIHGHTRTDNYFWLNERENPKVLELLKAENKYKDAVMENTKDLEDKLYKEIIGRIKKTDMSVPYKYQGYYYYTRYEEKSEYPIYCRKKESLNGKEEILLNVNEMAKGYKYFHVAGHSVSSNNNMIAYGVDTVSRRKYKLYFKNLETGEILKEEIPNTTGRAAWANDNKTVFYPKKDKTLRSHKIFKHIIRTDVSKDKEIYHEKDPTFSTFVFKSKSKKYIFIGSYHTLSSEYRFLEANKPDGEFEIIQKREKDLEYSVDHYKDKFYIRTNYKAKNFKLIETSIKKTSKENWKDVIPHRENVLLERFQIFKDFLVLGERENGLTELRVIRWDKKDDYYINFEEQTYMAYISTNTEFDIDLLRFGYTSLTTPNSIFDYNMNSKERKLLKQEEVIGDFDPKNYFAERLYVIARDKTKVPISLVYKKGLKKDGNNPLLLYGYGSYGASMNPYFSSVRLSLLDRGFVYAIAHIRGGQEMGRSWYEDGKLLKKKNTFFDFIDCAEYLIKEKYTNSKKLFAMGGSAGGLLMGVIINMRPDLFKGIVASVPWVDVITTMLDDSIPLTTAEFDEWGDPKKKEYYEYMLSYSPYDNIAEKAYPAMLISTGFHDSQVQYFEPAKWAQKLREKSTSKNVILFHINMAGGHGGVSGRFRRYKETAMKYVFMLDLAEIKK